MVAGKAWRAEALVGAVLIHADPIDAQGVTPHLAFVHVFVTILPLEAVLTLALETVFPEIDTRAVVARFRRAMVNDKGTIRIPVTLAAFALVTGDTIDANLAVGTYDIDTVVHVYIANLALKAPWTLADKLAPQPRYHRTIPAILAGIYRADVVLAFTILVHEILRAVASVPVDLVDAGATILTRLRQTLVHVDLAVFPSVSRKTLAVVAIELIDADAAVAARITGALVHVGGAFKSRPSWLTGAIIAAGIIVASGSLLAR